jgi:hypothetical protein
LVGDSYAKYYFSIWYSSSCFQNRCGWVGIICMLEETMENFFHVNIANAYKSGEELVREGF